jgi:hypothetical protein
MTNTEKLTKIIERAIENGWDSFDATDWFKVYEARNGRIQVEFRPHVNAMGLFYDYTAIVFGHEFSQSLWGKLPKIWDTEDDYLENWQFQLQEAVISKDPIEYIYSSIYGEEKGVE